MSSTHSEFIPPPEAPVFRPTADEFNDPLEYINKIRRVAQRSGICKIVPPPEWNPPFCVDVDTFKFTPRVQRLNELEAKTRIKLNFLDHLAKFWELQGMPLKIPLVDKRYLDLHSLHKVVNEDRPNGEKPKSDLANHNWAKVAIRMGYPSGKGIGNILRQHYEKILYPYDLVLSGAKFQKDSDGSQGKIGSNETNDLKSENLSLVANNENNDSKSDSIRIKAKDPKPDSDNKVYEIDDSNSKVKEASTIATESHKPSEGKISNEMRRLQYYGAGPKAAVPKADAFEDTDLSIGPFSKLTRMKTRIKGNPGYEGMELYCRTCEAEGDNDSLLVCDGCDAMFHLFCLVPPLDEMPHGDWRCPPCVALECQRPMEVYGFAQAKREYSLQSFGEMADKFKKQYFACEVTSSVPCSVVEKEFWRLVNCIEEDVVVEYGADVHASECGSGFPTASTRDRIGPEEEHYITAGWNLNNLPNLKQSVLQYVNVDISGMKVPWCYVGMCFSSFAWHIEDHWSYSINYLHWGEPKTWYGVPGAKAELFEECMRSNAPELFEQSPDLLHQLTTIMNPNTLMEFGVPIVRTNQHAGEYVVTFPRAYHSGFNQGYNFAEAVNFCPADWLPIGRTCVDHYRTLKRQCVFSHEELISKMAAEPQRLDHTLASMVHQDLLALVESEKRLRKGLLSMGLCDAEKEAFELLPDDERQCDFCKTTCFFSAVTCPCSETKIVCARHVDKLCNCPPSRLCLRYRHTLDELLSMLHRVQLMEESFDNWVTRSREAMGRRGTERLAGNEFKQLIDEAKIQNFPSCALLDALVCAAEEGERCSIVSRELLRMMEEQQPIGDSSNDSDHENKEDERLSVDELREFLNQMDTLPCSVPEYGDVNELFENVARFQSEVIRAVETDPPEPEKITRLLAIGKIQCVRVPELQRLKRRLPSAGPRTSRPRRSQDMQNSEAPPAGIKKRRISGIQDANNSETPLGAIKKRIGGIQDNSEAPVGGIKKRVGGPEKRVLSGKSSRTCQKKSKLRGAPRSKYVVLIEEDGNARDVPGFDDDYEGEEDTCSADKCCAPADEEVEWVQCDGCQHWFHFLCIGLDRADIGENEDYVCRRCKEASVALVRQPSNTSLTSSILPQASLLQRLPSLTINPSLSLTPYDDYSSQRAIDISDSESEAGSDGAGIIQEWYGKAGSAVSDMDPVQQIDLELSPGSTESAHSLITSKSLDDVILLE